jgi:hypothetical protein
MAFSRKQLLEGFEVDLTDQPANEPKHKSKKRIPKGKRHTWLVQQAGRLRRSGLAQDEIRLVLESRNQASCDPPASDKEVGDVATSTAKWERGDPDSGPPELTPLSGEDFLARKLPVRQMIMAPWLPVQGLAMVHAKRGVGKTHFALWLAVAVATGGSFMKWDAKKPRRVLYIDGEMPAPAFQERLAAVKKSCGEDLSNLVIVNPDFQTQGMPNLASIPGQDAVEPLLKDVALVVVDNISTLCRGGKENDAESWEIVQLWAIRLRSQGISVLFVHHAGKSGEQRGTSRREDVMDTVIKLEHPEGYESAEGAYFNIEFEKNRGFWGEDAVPFSVMLEEKDGIQEWTIYGVPVTEKGQRIDEVARLLNEGKPQKEIAKELGVVTGTISKDAKKARQQGLVSKNPLRVKMVARLMNGGWTHGLIALRTRVSIEEVATDAEWANKLSYLKTERNRASYISGFVANDDKKVVKEIGKLLRDGWPDRGIELLLKPWDFDLPTMLTQQRSLLKDSNQHECVDPVVQVAFYAQLANMEETAAWALGWTDDPVQPIIDEQQLRLNDYVTQARERGLIGEYTVLLADDW